MTDFTQPVLPPPPPPPAVPARTFDFAKPFSFVFEDPDWIKKIAIGGLMYLAAFFIVGIFFILGYCARLARNVVEGVARPLPEWDDLGEYFTEGLKLFLVMLAYFLPFLLIIAILIGGTALMGTFAEDNPMTGCAIAAVFLLLVPLYLIVAIITPAALIYAMVTRDASAAFDFSRIWHFIKANVGNYALAIAVYLIANFMSQFGMILLCVGVVFTAFWSLLVTVYAFAETYALAKER